MAEYNQSNAHWKWMDKRLPNYWALIGLGKMQWKSVHDLGWINWQYQSFSQISPKVTNLSMNMCRLGKSSNVHYDLLVIIPHKWYFCLCLNIMRREIQAAPFVMARNSQQCPTPLCEGTGLLQWYYYKKAQNDWNKSGAVFCKNMYYCKIWH